jgi:hypothetical protein
LGTGVKQPIGDVGRASGGRRTVGS